MNHEDDDLPEDPRCLVKWPAPRTSLCRPEHRCEEPRDHKGPHKCEAGCTRRNMRRDSEDGS